MLESLKDNKLEVILISAPIKMHHDHKIREITSQNPGWYKDLCAAYITNRLKIRKRKNKYSDTKIRRKQIYNVLKKLCGVGYTHSIYAEDLFEIARELKILNDRLCTNNEFPTQEEMEKFGR